MEEAKRARRGSPHVPPTSEALVAEDLHQLPYLPPKSVLEEPELVQYQTEQHLGPLTGFAPSYGVLRHTPAREGRFADLQPGSSIKKRILVNPEVLARLVAVAEELNVAQAEIEVRRLIRRQASSRPLGAEGAGGLGEGAAGGGGPAAAPGVEVEVEQLLMPVEPTHEHEATAPARGEDHRPKRPVRGVQVRFPAALSSKIPRERWGYFRALNRLQPAAPAGSAAAAAEAAAEAGSKAARRRHSTGAAAVKAAKALERDAIRAADAAVAAEMAAAAADPSAPPPASSAGLGDASAAAGSAPGAAGRNSAMGSAVAALLHREAVRQERREAAQATALLEGLPVETWWDIVQRRKKAVYYRNLAQELTQRRGLLQAHMAARTIQKAWRQHRRERMARAASTLDAEVSRALSQGQSDLDLSGSERQSGSGTPRMARFGTGPAASRLGKTPRGGPGTLSRATSGKSGWQDSLRGGPGPSLSRSVSRKGLTSRTTSRARLNVRPYDDDEEAARKEAEDYAAQQQFLWKKIQILVGNNFGVDVDVEGDGVGDSEAERGEADDEQEEGSGSSNADSSSDDSTEDGSSDSDDDDSSSEYDSDGDGRAEARRIARRAVKQALREKRKADRAAAKEARARAKALAKAKAKAAKAKAKMGRRKRVPAPGPGGASVSSTPTPGPKPARRAKVGAGAKAAAQAAAGGAAAAAAAASGGDWRTRQAAAATAMGLQGMPRESLADVLATAVSAGAAAVAERRRKQQALRERRRRRAAAGAVRRPRPDPNDPATIAAAAASLGVSVEAYKAMKERAAAGAGARAGKAAGAADGGAAGAGGRGSRAGGPTPAPEEGALWPDLAATVGQDTLERLKAQAREEVRARRAAAAAAGTGAGTSALAGPGASRAPGVGGPDPTSRPPEASVDGSGTAASAGGTAGQGGTRAYIVRTPGDEYDDEEREMIELVRARLRAAGILPGSGTEDEGSGADGGTAADGAGGSSDSSYETMSEDEVRHVDPAVLAEIEAQKAAGLPGDNMFAAKLAALNASAAAVRAVLHAHAPEEPRKRKSRHVPLSKRSYSTTSHRDASSSHIGAAGASPGSFAWRPAGSTSSRWGPGTSFHDSLHDDSSFASARSHRRQRSTSPDVVQPSGPSLLYRADTTHEISRRRRADKMSVNRPTWLKGSEVPGAVFTQFGWVVPPASPAGVQQPSGPADPLLPGSPVPGQGPGPHPPKLAGPALTAGLAALYRRLGLGAGPGQPGAWGVFGHGAGGGAAATAGGGGGPGAGGGQGPGLEDAMAVAMAVLRSGSVKALVVRRLFPRGPAHVGDLPGPRVAREPPPDPHPALRRPAGPHHHHHYHITNDDGEDLSSSSSWTSASEDEAAGGVGGRGLDGLRRPVLVVGAPGLGLAPRGGGASTTGGGGISSGGGCGGGPTAAAAGQGTSRRSSPQRVGQRELSLSAANLSSMSYSKSSAVQLAVPMTQLGLGLMLGAQASAAAARQASVSEGFLGEPFVDEDDVRQFDMLYDMTRWAVSRPCTPYGYSHESELVALTVRPSATAARRREDEEAAAAARAKVLSSSTVAYGNTLGRTVERVRMRRRHGHVLVALDGVAGPRAQVLASPAFLEAVAERGAAAFGARAFRRGGGFRLAGGAATASAAGGGGPAPGFRSWLARRVQPPHLRKPKPAAAVVPSGYSVVSYGTLDTVVQGRNVATPPPPSLGSPAPPSSPPAAYATAAVGPASPPKQEPSSAAGALPPPLQLPRAAPPPTPPHASHVHSPGHLGSGSRSGPLTMSQHGPRQRLALGRAAPPGTAAAAAAATAGLSLPASRSTSSITAAAGMAGGGVLVTSLQRPYSPGALTADFAAGMVPRVSDDASLPYSAPYDGLGSPYSTHSLHASGGGGVSPHAPHRGRASPVPPPPPSQPQPQSPHARVRVARRSSEVPPFAAVTGIPSSASIGGGMGSFSGGTVSGSGAGGGGVGGGGSPTKAAAGPQPHRPAAEGRLRSLLPTTPGAGGAAGGVAAAAWARDDGDWVHMVAPATAPSFSALQPPPPPLIVPLSPPFKTASSPSHFGDSLLQGPGSGLGSGPGSSVGSPAAGRRLASPPGHYGAPFSAYGHRPSTSAAAAAAAAAAAPHAPHGARLPSEASGMGTMGLGPGVGLPGPMLTTPLRPVAGPEAAAAASPTAGGGAARFAWSACEPGGGPEYEDVDDAGMSYMYGSRAAAGRAGLSKGLAFPHGGGTGGGGSSSSLLPSIAHVGPAPPTPPSASPLHLNALGGGSGAANRRVASVSLPISPLAAALQQQAAQQQQPPTPADDAFFQPPPQRSQPSHLSYHARPPPSPDRGMIRRGRAGLAGSGPLPTGLSPAGGAAAAGGSAGAGAWDAAPGEPPPPPLLGSQSSWMLPDIAPPAKARRNSLPFYSAASASAAAAFAAQHQQAAAALQHLGPGPGPGLGLGLGLGLGHASDSGGLPGGHGGPAAAGTRPGTGAAGGQGGPAVGPSSPGPPPRFTRMRGSADGEAVGMGLAAGGVGLAAAGWEGGGQGMGRPAGGEAAGEASGGRVSPAVSGAGGGKAGKAGGGNRFAAALRRIW
ncbi:hypothetical protein HYH03_009187 [Edaphochlamys debaryana]|uniref:Uncharacterized protein n=1 Tax=Edaphochlamys debaryana TaxID=47281 RepID=A0A836BY15_9CHLO|nr:hypothetical protein HYH03_009187 [Edaphochlamys debaryana]|eukprot:KAG2492522.1 hypothetical protein HYH03_009187 [Edaphochlamys debaryana]